MQKKIFKAYKLKFTSPIHISIGKDDDYSSSYHILHSDTLKSAIFSTALIVNSKLQEQTNGEQFFNSFILSSALPYYNDILFLPKPKGDLPLTDNQNNKPSYDFKKALKKVNYIDFDLFLEILANKKENLIKFNPEKIQIISSYITYKDKLDKNDIENFFIYKSYLHDRVYIRKLHEIYDDEDNKYKFSDPFVVDRLFFNKNAGLYFIVETFDNFDEKLFDDALKLLGEHGIGSYRNIDNGHFKVYEQKHIELEYDNEAKFLTNISLFLPTANEIPHFNNNSQYKIIKRGGWISNLIDLHKLRTFKIKKSVFMIEEASLFENNYNFTGKIADLSPYDNDINHPVWRDGRAIFIPINNVKN